MGFAGSLNLNGLSIPGNVATTVKDNDTSLAMVMYFTDALFSSASSVTLATKILSLELEGISSGQTLDQPITFIFSRNSSSSTTNVTDKCSYWDESGRQWLQDGCTKDEALSNSTHIVCLCSHLTNFAVLADSTGASASLSEEDSKALELITYIGCSISIFCLVITVVTYLRYKVCGDMLSLHKLASYCFFSFLCLF